MSWTKSQQIKHLYEQGKYLRIQHWQIVTVCFGERETQDSQGLWYEEGINHPVSHKNYAGFIKCFYVPNYWLYNSDDDWFRRSSSHTSWTGVQFQRKLSHAVRRLCMHFVQGTENYKAWYFIKSNHGYKALHNMRFETLNSQRIQDSSERVTQVPGDVICLGEALLEGLLVSSLQSKSSVRPCSVLYPKVTTRAVVSYNLHSDHQSPSGSRAVKTWRGVLSTQQQQHGPGLYQKEEKVRLPKFKWV